MKLSGLPSFGEFHCVRAEDTSGDLKNENLMEKFWLKQQAAPWDIFMLNQRTGLSFTTQTDKALLGKCQSTIYSSLVI